MPFCLQCYVLETFQHLVKQMRAVFLLNQIFHHLSETEESSTSTQQARGKYLMEKYARRWMVEAKKSPESLHLGGTTWLRRVLFSPSSRSARQVACNIVESICQVSYLQRNILLLKYFFMFSCNITADDVNVIQTTTL